MKRLIIFLFLLIFPQFIYSQQSSLEYFTGSEDQTAREKTSGQKRVIVDTFDRQNPLTMYRVIEDDESQLEIYASPMVHSGVNSMKLEYILSTKGQSPSKVSVIWYGEDNPLNWETGEELRLWVKGDGTGNVFKLVLVDNNNKRWYYKDLEILRRSEWNQLKIKLSSFRLELYEKEKNINLTGIQRIEFIIKGKDADYSHGEIYLDDLILDGMSLDSSIAALQDVSLVPQALAIGLMNVKFNLLGVATAKHTPVDGMLMTSWLHFDIVGNVRNAIVESRLTVGDVNYGYGAINGPLREGKHYKKDYRVKGGYIKLSLLYLTPYISKLSVGNLKVDYSRYTYSPYHTSEEDPQYKGASFEGGFDFLDYHTFFIKHWGNAGTFGSSLIANYKGYVLRTIYVGVINNARSSSSVMVDGELQWTSDFASKIVDKDNVITVQLSKSYLGDFLNIEIEAGYNDYKSYADFSIPDAANPVPRWEYDYVSSDFYNGIMYHADLRVIPIGGTVLEAKYLNFDEDFKPLFRDSPSFFDEEWTDQVGYEAKVSQFYKWFVFSCGRKDIKRKSNKDYFYNYWRASIEYNFSGFYVGYTRQWRNDFYKYTSYKSSFTADKDQKSDVDFIKAIFRIGGKIEVSAAYGQENVKYNFNDEELLKTEMEFSTWYFLTQTTKIEVKSKSTKHGFVILDRPGNSRDNYTEVILEMKF